MPPPDHIPIASARLQDGRYMGVCLCALPRDSLTGILADFEAQRTWDDVSASVSQLFFITGIFQRRTPSGPDVAMVRPSGLKARNA